MATDVYARPDCAAAAYAEAGDFPKAVECYRASIEHDPERPQIVVTVRGVGYKAGPP